MRALVTGASGFVGSALTRELIARGVTVRAALRRGTQGEATESVEVPDFAAPFDWSAALDDVDVVFHVAALAHAPVDDERERLIRAVNVDATERLARAVMQSGVRRLVFVSSAKVHGEASGERPFVESDAPAPGDAYARSKAAAEQAIREVMGTSRFTIVRPPLVYGPGVRANFRALLRIVDRGIPLPLAAVRNRRSLIAVRNLAGVLAHLATDDRADGQTYLVSDGRDLSTPDLIRAIAVALDRPARLLPVPASFLRAAASVAGKRESLEKLIGSLAVDTGKVQALGWSAPVRIEDAMKETAVWYRAERH